jgi:hypothetical protein
MPNADVDPGDPSPRDVNRRLASLLLIAIVAITIVALLAGQVAAAGGGCGEPPPLAHVDGG